MINNELTWKNHLYGDMENEGLITQLSKRIGMMKKISKHMSQENLKYFASGIFYSKLNYCLPVFGNVFGLENYKEDNSRYQSFTTKENKNLQVLQNKAARIVTRLSWGTATRTLLNQIGWLSVKQLYLYQYHSLLLVFKMQHSGKPAYLKEKFRNNFAYQTRQATTSCFILNDTPRTEKCRKSFVHNNIITWNSLPADMRKTEKLTMFKLKLKEWVKKNVPI